MPRPEVKMVTFSIDGREVTAPENIDARRRRQVRRRRDPGLLLRAQARRARRRLPHVPGGDRGHPEAADRVLDAGQGRHGRPHPDRARAGGPARGGRVPARSTTRSTARSATRAASARCRTSPTAGARGTSRFIEPKRHFRKPLELSPLVAIDRERCILCYRCVRFSQEISEDYQLVLQERGAHAYVSHLRRHALRRRRSAATSPSCARSARSPRRAYRFRARPWDIEGSGSVCTLCPSQCNVTLTVRDDRVMRVLRPRQRGRRRRLAVRQGPLRLPVRPRRRAHHAAAGARGRQRCTRPRGRRRSPAAGAALKKAGGKAAAIAGGETTNEEAFLLQRLFRERPRLRRPRVGARRRAAGRRWRARWPPRRCRRRSPDLEFAHTVLLLDTRPGRRGDDLGPAHPQGRAPPRRQARRSRRARPTALDPNADADRAPRAGRARGRCWSALDAALSRRRGQPRRRRDRGRHQRRRRARPRRRCCATAARTSSSSPPSAA